MTTHGSFRDHNYPSFLVAEHLKMRGRPVWEWSSVPNTSSCSPSAYSVKKRVRIYIVILSFFFLFKFFSPVPLIKSLENRSCSFSFLSLGEFVAQFKFTVLLMANGPLRITSGPFEPELYKSECDVQDPELKVSSIHRQLWTKFITVYNL